MQIYVSIFDIKIQLFPYEINIVIDMVFSVVCCNNKGKAYMSLTFQNNSIHPYCTKSYIAIVLQFNTSSK